MCRFIHFWQLNVCLRIVLQLRSYIKCPVRFNNRLHYDRKQMKLKRRVYEFRTGFTGSQNNAHKLSV